MKIVINFKNLLHPRFLRVRKEAKRIADEIIKRQESYISMTKEQLAALDDEELYSALLDRTDQKVEEGGSIEAGIELMNEHERVFYAVSYLEMEVDNGGLCQFFINSSRAVAPLVSDYMGVIGADEHKALYDKFIAEYGIDVNNLESFDCGTDEEFSAQYDRYPFDEFDDAFCELKPLSEYLIAYAREHIDSL